MKNTSILTLLVGTVLLAPAGAAPYDPQLHETLGRTYSPKESLSKFELSPGFHLEQVATEPLINEPVLVTWDGNGQMYVAEMNRYMQDIDGKNQLDPVCQVVQLRDTNNDGIMDQRIVFADKLILPRMVQCIDDWVVIRETNTLDLYGYRDTDGDGVSDEKKLLYTGGNRGGNLEHQPSGLLWSIDNWMYVTYTARRYKWNGDHISAESLPAGTGQWGISHDDEGRHFFSTAGGERPAHDFQHAFLYGKSNMPDQEAKGFREVFPAVPIPDVQGGTRRFRAEQKTLNNFTGSAGAHIFRGTELPKEYYGDAFIPEPVGRLVRWAKRTNDNGVFKVSSGTPPGTEFIRAKDANFRPLFMETGPDGCLYMVDMYRGIIQEGNWVRKGSYLRGIVEQHGLDKNIQGGRVYRIMHTTSKRQPFPKLRDCSTAERVAALAHPNGWVRDNAQKILVARKETDALSALRAMLTQHANPLARLHALWTIDGIGATSVAGIQQALSDNDTRVRCGALRVSEDLLLAGNKAILPALKRCAATDKNPNVILQFCRSMGRAIGPDTEPLLAMIHDRYGDHPPVKATLSSFNKRRAEAKRAATQNALVREGQAHYQSLCFSCHGADGKGTPVEGQPGITLAPSLVDSSRLTGETDIPIKIVLKGMVGPLDGVTYPGIMLPLESYDDRYLAAVLSYTRQAWGNKAGLVSPQDVARVRKAIAQRKAPWLSSEIMAMTPITSKAMQSWALTASHGGDKVKSAIDGSPKSRFDTGSTQKPGMWFAVDMGRPVQLDSVVLRTEKSPDDYPRTWSIQVSDDGQAWSSPVAQGKGDGPVTSIVLPGKAARYFRITQGGTSSNKYWSIHELEVYGQ